MVPVRWGSQEEEEVCREERPSSLWDALSLMWKDLWEPFTGHATPQWSGKRSRHIGGNSCDGHERPDLLVHLTTVLAELD